MKKVFGRPQSMKKNIFHYCAGCGHSIAHRLIAEVIDELDIRGITIGVPPAGCAVLAYNYFDVDMIEAQHGRGPATATGIKRVASGPRRLFLPGGRRPRRDRHRREFPCGQPGGEHHRHLHQQRRLRHDRRPDGPDLHAGTEDDDLADGKKNRSGRPSRPGLRDSSRSFPGTAYIERCTVNSPASILKTKKAIRKAFQYQIDGHGFSLIEILSPCPTNWKMTPIDSCRWIDEVMSKQFPLGVMKDIPAAGTEEGG